MAPADRLVSTMFPTIQLIKVAPRAIMSANKSGMGLLSSSWEAARYKSAIEMDAGTKAARDRKYREKLCEGGGGPDDSGNRPGCGMLDMLTVRCFVCLFLFCDFIVARFECLFDFGQMKIGDIVTRKRDHESASIMSGPEKTGLQFSRRRGNGGSEVHLIT